MTKREIEDAHRQIVNRDSEKHYKITVQAVIDEMQKILDNDEDESWSAEFRIEQAINQLKRQL